MVLQQEVRFPIGVFDSGVGGLTVLQEVHRQLPNESVVYFGDTARLPYGKRSASEIIEYVYEILRWMQSEQVKMAIMACNTSSALALDIVRKDFDLPILGLILPGARAAVGKGKRIGVIATTATVRSEAYVRAICESDPQAQVFQVDCPEFVPLIESDRIHDPYTMQVARQYLQPLIEANIDTLVLGCTHYPHLSGVLRQILPPHVALVNPASYVVRAASQELDLMGLKCLDNRSDRARTRFFVSGEPERFAQVSRRWLGKLPLVEKVSLSPVELLS
ncbi:MAG: glutamate racemase [Pseudanabaena sp.]|jgi:glutamate racemase|nr:glutamate racemase [Pseudanabaena sp. M090S1SP2A07QC]MCA6505586.1 glutamate racemase [Pseudanabaena sp. M172S2SP2A07QC]MCA6517690.1 glutamate racemase [Pseudanabaena sp. M110S1SP2A07QC]MCA6521845.1 glutamate racemase [Pseudanabaena sp. M051S1SP2A07QC]MCA6526194.1 glutamate racemase [Pseudanabaena sp. M179S2SP2A07QC]MCA6531661.1 glutamate racemase [Pseudanabaena sp. M125S2SP2A07QC]MCA6536694.1 glutamate racemase [Pseudanabaena sp. M176S2SP2A07QC]MCA6539657.1 glutamate racemase [Pseudanabae